jgi:hypothetical protein
MTTPPKSTLNVSAAAGSPGRQSQMMNLADRELLGHDVLPPREASAPL